MIDADVLENPPAAGGGGGCCWEWWWREEGRGLFGCNYNEHRNQVSYFIVHFRRMDITSYEDRSDPESFRIEIAEKKNHHTFI
jgi:hypothetical protein